MAIQLTVEFGPLVSNQVKSVSVPSDDVLACVTGGSSEKDDLGLRH